MKFHQLCYGAGFAHLHGWFCKFSMTKKYGRILSTKSSKNISRCSVSLLLFNNRILGVCIPSFTVLVLELLCSFSAITNYFCFLWLLWQTTTNWAVYNDKKWLSHSSGGQKCQIKMLAGLCSLKARGEKPSLPSPNSASSVCSSAYGCITPVSICLHTAFFSCLLLFWLL